LFEVVIGSIPIGSTKPAELKLQFS
jgi:hypothetical protein